VTIGESVGSSSRMLSFDIAHVVGALNSTANVPVRGLAMVLFVGSGMIGVASRAERAGGSACEATAWISTTVVACKMSAGMTRRHQVTITSGARTSSATRALSFDIPRLFNITYGAECLSNLNFNGSHGKCDTYSGNTKWCFADGACGECCECASACGGSNSTPPFATTRGGTIEGSFNSITINGVNFGVYPSSLRVQIGATYSPTISWISDSSVACRVPRAETPRCTELSAVSVTCSGPCPCGSHYRSSGSFSDGPSNYGNDQNCSWLVASSYPTNIMIAFSSFHTESGHDFVTINECLSASCATPRQLARLAGSAVSASTVYTASTGFLEVVFGSDGSTTFPGFEAAWSTDARNSTDLVHGSTSCLSWLTHDCDEALPEFSAPEIVKDTCRLAAAAARRAATCGGCICSAEFFSSEAIHQHLGGSCRPDHAVLVEVPDEKRSDENRSATVSSFLGVANCTADSAWMDTSGNTCGDYRLNAMALHSTYDCAFTGVTIRQDVGALTDGEGEYGRFARCRWIIVSKSASSLTLSITELDTKLNDTLRVYQCLNGSCESGLVQELGQSPFSSTASNDRNSLPVNLTSDTGMMLVEFSGGNTSGHQGFFARFAASSHLAVLKPSYNWLDWCSTGISPQGVPASDACCHCRAPGLAADLRYRYECPSGYQRYQDFEGAYCAEVNECGDSHSCILDTDLAECINTAGSFYCSYPGDYLVGLGVFIPSSSSNSSEETSQILRPAVAAMINFDPADERITLTSINQTVLRGLLGLTADLQIRDLAQSTAEHIAKLLTEPRFNAQIEAGILPSGTLLWRSAHATPTPTPTPTHTAR